MSLEARKGPIYAAFSGLSLAIVLLPQVVGRADLIRRPSIICCYIKKTSYAHKGMESALLESPDFMAFFGLQISMTFPSG